MLPDKLKFLVRPNLYVVGGFVRDFLLKRESTDIDFAYEGNVFELAETLGIRCIKFNKYLAISFEFENFTISVSSTRKDKPYVQASILEDPYRRDFTINSIYYDLTNKEILDPLSGRADLENKLIRMVAPFSEDHSRVVRALRFKELLGFELEKKSEILLKKEFPLRRESRVLKELTKLPIIESKYNIFS